MADPPQPQGDGSAPGFDETKNLRKKKAQIPQEYFFQEGLSATAQERQKEEKAHEEREAVRVQEQETRQRMLAEDRKQERKAAQEVDTWRTKQKQIVKDEELEKQRIAQEQGKHAEFERKKKKFDEQKAMHIESLHQVARAEATETRKRFERGDKAKKFLEEAEQRALHEKYLVDSEEARTKELAEKEALFQKQQITKEYADKRATMFAQEAQKKTEIETDQKYKLSMISSTATGKDAEDRKAAQERESQKKLAELAKLSQKKRNDLATEETARKRQAELDAMRKKTDAENRSRERKMEIEQQLRLDRMQADKIRKGARGT
ncbi:MAG: hypothetical protein Q7R81_06825 [Candidatus Peregrinibacteria bacterium]|nr:hypothetical protein [Candidatus Peregrinibacteria bacterium]